MSRILVIEDDELIRTSLIEMLQMEDYDVVEAGNGVHGLDLAFHEQPDLIICDVMMPELNGYEVLSALQTQPETSSIPFIFLTARADRPDITKGLQLGARAYLTKPFSRSELLTTLTGWLPT
jgi:CheY-like chemotaxis protein